jgi:ketosteroid isomerase-like protein
MSQHSVRAESKQQSSDKSKSRSPGSGSQRAVRSQAGPDDRASVQEYLDRFATAMTSGDTKTMARLWGVPAFVVGAEMAKVVQSEDEVEEFFSGAKAMYAERGIMDTRADIEDLDWISEDLVIATVRWPYLDQNEKELGAERSSYTLLRGEDGSYKVRAITMRGEERKQTG